MGGPEQAEHLKSFLSGSDLPCPGCGYNLRGVTGTKCPECAHELVLQIKPPELRLAWFLWGLVVQAGVGGYLIMALLLMGISGGPAQSVFLLLVCLSAVTTGAACWIGYRGPMTGLSGGARAALAGLCIAGSIALVWISLFAIM